LAFLAVSSSVNPSKEKRHRIARESIPVDGPPKSSGLLKIITAMFEVMTKPEQKKIKEPPPRFENLIRCRYQHV